MDFRFTDEQEMMRDTVRKFVEREMPVEKVREWDKQEVTPNDLYKKMAEVGLLGASIPEEYGGSGGGVIEETLIAENFVSLEDSSPAARTRAFDWLRRRGLAPAGYEPVHSTVQERRAALAKAQEKPEGDTP